MDDVHAANTHHFSCSDRTDLKILRFVAELSQFLNWRAQLLEASNGGSFHAE